MSWNISSQRPCKKQKNQTTQVSLSESAAANTKQDNRKQRGAGETPVKEVKLCHAEKIKSDARPLLRWFGWGSSWISERVLAGGDGGASRLQVLRLLKGDAIRGRYGYHRPVPCSGIRCVAMQTSPAASVKFSLEDVLNPSRLNGGGGGGTNRLRRGETRSLRWFILSIRGVKNRYLP